MSKNNNQLNNNYHNRLNLAVETDARFERTAAEPFIHAIMKKDCIGIEDLRPRTNRDGAEKLAQAGIDYFNKVVSKEVVSYYTVVLPHNLVNGGPAVGQPHGRKRGFVDPDHKVLELYARFGGWMKKAADSPACRPLRKLIEKTMSPNGIHSPYTQLDLWKVVEGYRSPETASRRLVKIRRRANQILSPFGVFVSNRALAEVMQGFRHVGKAARTAAKITL